MYKTYELKIFENIKFLGEISSYYPNILLGINMYKALQSSWESLLTIFLWSNTSLVIYK